MDKNEKILNEFEYYRNKIEQLEKELREAKGEKAQKVVKPEISIPKVDDNFIEEDWFNKIQINDDLGIICVSLSHTHIVNIVCGRYGGSSVIYTLKEFGQRAVIPYKELREAIRFHRSQYEQGFYAILSEDFLKKHDLVSCTQKFLNQNVLEQMINASIPVDDFLKLYKFTSEEQKKMIVAMIATNLAKDQNAYDQYFISKLTRAVKIDIEQLADDIAIYFNLSGQVDKPE